MRKESEGKGEYEEIKRRRFKSVLCFLRGVIFVVVVWV